MAVKWTSRGLVNDGAIAALSRSPTDSASWTGRDGTAATVEAARIETPRVELAPKLKPRVDASIMHDAALAEYKSVAAEIGVSAQDILVEEFRAFLAKHDIPTFNHQEVVSYMDDIAARENPTKCGWHWCPVREKDAVIPMTFGRPSVDNQHRNFRDGKAGEIVPSSDYYESHRFRAWHEDINRGSWGNSLSRDNGNTTVNVESNVRLMQAAHDEMFQRPPTPRDWRTMPSPAYTRTIPLHALKKIALVEREFKVGPVVFLVTDYTVAPHIVINPDPFLMAIIPNSALAHGKGRFIIDVWDEPGFGIERMLKV